MPSQADLKWTPSPSFCSGPRRSREPLDAERADRRLGDAVENETCDGVGGDRRKQNSVAVVTGGIDEPIQWPGFYCAFRLAALPSA